MCDRDSVLLVLLWSAIVLGCMGQLRLALAMLVGYGLVKFINATLPHD